MSRKCTIISVIVTTLNSVKNYAEQTVILMHCSGAFWTVWSVMYTALVIIVKADTNSSVHTPSSYRWQDRKVSFCYIWPQLVPQHELWSYYLRPICNTLMTSHEDALILSVNHCMRNAIYIYMQWNRSIHFDNIILIVNTKYILRVVLSSSLPTWNN